MGTSSCVRYSVPDDFVFNFSAPGSGRSRGFLEPIPPSHTHARTPAASWGWGGLPPGRRWPSDAQFPLSNEGSSPFLYGFTELSCIDTEFRIPGSGGGGVPRCEFGEFGVCAGCSHACKWARRPSHTCVPPGGPPFPDRPPPLRRRPLSLRKMATGFGWRFA